jgi:putative tricarboxylic transport membrane protein
LVKNFAPGGVLVAAVCAAGWLALFATGVSAQSTWRPDKAVELVVTTAPGGANDQIARAMQKALREEKLLATPLEIVNKPGGNQTIGVAYVNQHAADPHYLLLANPTLLGSHIAGVTTLNYTDLTPIALLLSEHTVFSVAADSAIRTAADLFGRLKADPEAVAFGIVGRGGPSHLALAAAAKTAGVDARKLKTVVFKTSPESITAMMGGHIHVVASSVSSALSTATSGKTRIVAVVAAQRMTGALSNVPTLREQGIDVTQASWRAVFAPKGITAAQLAYWDDALMRMAATAEWKKTLESNNWVGLFLRGSGLTAYLEDSYRVTRATMTDVGLAK